GAQPRDFNAGSLSAGALFTLTPVWSIAANVAYTERAPTFYELYSNGPHDATGSPSSSTTRPVLYSVR
ncbi:TonB-dependent receptor, partial [Burkholderia cenocepacia]|nr:TonB-dependent receptor [Burkholderia cenocepacia]